MLWRSMTLAGKLAALGAVFVVIGLFLLLVRLLMEFSQLAELILLIGALILVIALIVSKLKGRRNEGRDRIPYV